MGRFSEFLVLLLRHAVTGLVAIIATILIGKLSGVFATARIEVIDPSEAVLMFVRHVGVDQSEATYGEQVRQFHDRLIAEVRAYSRQTGVVVLNSAVVLDGAPDVTRELVARALQTRLDHASNTGPETLRLVRDE